MGHPTGIEFRDPRLAPNRRARTWGTGVPIEEKERQTKFGLQAWQLQDQNGSESSRFALGGDGKIARLCNSWLPRLRHSRPTGAATQR
jgi:hypothetical protein